MLAAAVLLLAAIIAKGEGTLKLLDAANFADRFYTNPGPVHDIGDPTVFYAEGSFWMVATSAPNGFRMWRSPDLGAWEECDMAYRIDPATSWCTGSFWAPEVHRVGDAYYLVFSATWYGHNTMRIGIARSDSPGGPYVNLKNEPLFDPGYATIDAHLVFTPAGEPWLYFARDCSENVIGGIHTSQICAVRLTEDLMDVVGEPVLLTTPDQPWEFASGDEYRWNEGPYVVRHGGRYWLFYSANYYQGREYGVGVAVSDAPDGPYAKLDASPLLRWAEDADGAVRVSGPGHNACFEVEGERFTSYHTHYQPHAPNADRQLAIDRMGFHGDGTPYIDGPTLAPQPKPLAVLGLRSLLGEAACESSLSDAAPLTDGDTCVAPSSEPWLTSFGAGDWVEYRWARPVRADSLLLWAPAGQEAVARLSIDGGEPIALDLAELDPLPGSALRLFFEPIGITSLRLEFDRPCRLGELMLLGPDGD